LCQPEPFHNFIRDINAFFRMTVKMICSVLISGFDNWFSYIVQEHGPSQDKVAFNIRHSFQSMHSDIVNMIRMVLAGIKTYVKLRKHIFQKACFSQDKKIFWPVRNQYFDSSFRILSGLTFSISLQFSFMAERTDLSISNPKWSLNEQLSAFLKDLHESGLRGAYCADDGLFHVLHAQNGSIIPSSGW